MGSNVTNSLYHNKGDAVGLDEEKPRIDVEELATELSVLAGDVENPENRTKALNLLSECYKLDNDFVVIDKAREMLDDEFPDDYYAKRWIDEFRVKCCDGKPAVYIRNEGKEIHVDMSSLTEEELDSLVNLLKDNSVVEGLSWSGCNELAVKAIEEILKSNTTLKTFHIICGDSVNVEGLNKILVSVNNNNTLKCLNLEGFDFVGGGAECLSNFLNLNSTLLHLCVCGEFDLTGMQMISESLKSNSTLTYLEIVNSGMKCCEIEMLFEALKSNGTLQSLSLYDNSQDNDDIDIEDDGADKIAEFLMTNTTLTHLNLSNCNINDDQAKKIAEGLNLNSTLYSLNLSFNTITVVGEQFLFDALKSNSTLIELNLSGC